MLGGLLGLQLLGAPTASATPEPPAVVAEDTSSPQRFHAIELNASGLDAEALRAELSLRLPELHVYARAEGARFDRRDAPYLYVELRRDEDGSAHELTVIASDGRLYERAVPIEDDEPERALASTIANTIAAIETGTIEPDQTGTAIPGVAAADPPREPLARHQQPTPPAPPPVTPPPRLELGLDLGAGSLLGVGPPRYGDVFLGWFGALGLSLRARTGGLALLELRVGGRHVIDTRLTRIRVLAGGGYAWRRDHLEVALALALFVEPWIVRPGDGVIVSGASGAAQRPPPLLGAALRLSPGYRVELANGGALRVGPRLELAGGFALTSAGATVAGVGARNGAGELAPRVRLGGLELLSGVELVLWFDVP